MEKEEGVGSSKRHRSAYGDKPDQPFKSAWEKRCNSKYVSLRKITPYDPSNIDEFRTLS